VTERWLEQVIDPLTVITAAEGPALDRARRWFVTLNTTKRRLAEDDPDPFATYLDLLDDSPEMVDTHIGALLGQLEVIIRQGVDRERSAPTTRPPQLARCSTP
jgi:Tetracyclin repressor-like, C-terminal domain